MRPDHSRKILLGYLAACVTVGVGIWGLPVLLSIADTIVTRRPWLAPHDSIGITVLILLIYMAITIIATMIAAAVPSLLLIMIAERIKLRAWWAYTIGAAVIGIISYFLMPFALPWTRGAPFDRSFAAFFAGFGAAAGAVYWFFGVRRRADQVIEQSG